MSRLVKRIIIIATTVAILGSVTLFFVLSGNITTEVKDNKLYIKAYYIGSDPVASTITSELSSFEINFAESFEDEGKKIDAVSLPKLNVGRYKNSSFGDYFLYKYKSNKCIIILSSPHSTYIINGKNRDKTWDLYIMLRAESGQE